jgi:hypothetical protein
LNILNALFFVVLGKLIGMGELQLGTDIMPWLGDAIPFSAIFRFSAKVASCQSFHRKYNTTSSHLPPLNSSHQLILCAAPVEATYHLVPLLFISHIHDLVFLTAAMAELTEKSQDTLSYFTSNAIVQRLSDVVTSLQERREALGLSNPGTVDNISREVDRDVFLTNQAFSGLRAEIAKSFSMSPMFQVSHSLSMGSQALNPYNFAAMYGSPRVCAKKTSPGYGKGSRELTYTLRSSAKAPLTMTLLYRDASTGGGLRVLSLKLALR